MKSTKVSSCVNRNDGVRYLKNVFTVSDSIPKLTKVTETGANIYLNNRRLNGCSEFTPQNLDIQNITNIEHTDVNDSTKVPSSDAEQKQNSKDAHDATPESEILGSKHKRCRRPCKDVTFHQFLVFTCISLNVFISVGLPFSLGVLYPEFKLTFHSSNAEAATIVSVATGLITSGGIVGGLLVNKIGSRFTILLGALLSFTGTFASFFAMNIWFLVFALGGMMGFGNAIVYIPSMVVISEQFPNSMMATMIITAARPAGVITFPLLINVLLDVYFWRGTLLITSGLILNICVAGLIATHKGSSSPSSDPVVCSPTKKKIFDVSVLKIPKFLLIMVYHSIINSSISAMFVMLVDFCLEQGYNRDVGVLILTLQAVFAMLARGLVGILLLLPQWIRPPQVVLFFIAGTIGSVLLLLTPLASLQFNTFIGLISLWGLFVGIRNAIIPVLCLQIVGKDQYPIALGISQTFIGIFTIIAGPIGGMIRDLTGNYRITFMASGSVSLVASIVASVMYVIFFTNYCKFTRKNTDVPV